MTNEDMKKEISTVLNFLRVPLSSSPVAVEEAGSEAESWYGRMTAIEAIAISELEKAKLLRLPVKSSDKTEFDRKIELEALVWEEERFKNLAHGAVKALELRVNYCQSLLKIYGKEAQRTPFST